LKKSRKKLLRCRAELSRSGAEAKSTKSFLLLFFKKQDLPAASRRAGAAGRDAINLSSRFFSHHRFTRKGEV
jgi:hypothetical protein